MYAVVQVPPDAYELPEQLGTKRKFWYQDPAKNWTLFKEGRPGTGENWAEKVASELCALLQIPHANYEFARWRDHDGVVTPRFLTEDSRLVLGNELLGKLVKDYQPSTTRYESRHHTVQLVMAIMKWPEIALPVDYVSPNPVVTQAADLFVSYLMLDTLISNQDRHHENWGLIVSPGRRVHLTPTFDHASSLGRNETDEARNRRLGTKDVGDSVEAYVGRARSAMYSGVREPKLLLTLDAYVEAARTSPAAANYWLDRLQATTTAQYDAIFANIPAHLISEPAKSFALKMLEINKARLLGRRQVQA